MTLPATSGALIDDVDFNDVRAVLDQLLGLNDDGYGIASFNSMPVAPGERLDAQQWNTLIKDVNFGHVHITNAATSTAYAVTGTSVVTTTRANDLYAAANWMLDPVRRWTCHPSQFKYNTSTNSVLFNQDGSTSTRTLDWGIATRSISHKVVVSWPTRDQAYYYFNQGAYLSWQPFHFNDGLNDLDTEWANFLNEISTAADHKYDRSDFRYWPGGTQTEYTSVSGLLKVLVEGVVSNDERTVTFTITYSNLDDSLLIISPTVGYWNVIV